MTMIGSITMLRLSIGAALAAAAMVAAMLLLSAGPASAALCVAPNEGPGQSNVADYVAEPPPAPEDFMDRGSSMDNHAGKLAAWEAHFNSPVVFGPESCEDIFG
jgi:hypothetical protein